MHPPFAYSSQCCQHGCVPSALRTYSRVPHNITPGNTARRSGMLVGMHRTRASAAWRALRCRGFADEPGGMSSHDRLIQSLKSSLRSADRASFAGGGGRAGGRSSGGAGCVLA